MARANAPWFRKSKNTWYTTLDGKKISLGVRGEANEKEALKTWHRLLGGLPLETPQKPLPMLPEPPSRTASRSEARKRSGRDYGVSGRFWRKDDAGLSAELPHLSPALYRPLRDAESMTVTEAEAFARKPEWSLTYRNGMLGSLITAYRWAERAHVISQNPLHGIRKPPKASRGAKALVSAEAHARLCEHADAFFRAFLQLLWLTGARPGEIASLTASCIDLAQSVAVLTEHHKTAHLGKVRIVFLCPEAVAILRERIALHPEGLLFPGQNGRLTAQAIGRRLARVCEKAGVKSCIAYG